MFRAYIKPIFKRHVYKSAVVSCLILSYLVHVPVEDGLNVSPKHVWLRHYNSKNVHYVGYYRNTSIEIFVINNVT
jgi:hypothetical protein